MVKFIYQGIALAVPADIWGSRKHPNILFLLKHQLENDEHHQL